MSSVGPYELWMLAQAALGFTVYGGVIFLIPLHVLEQGGTPADTGAVIALIGVLALAGPFVGRLADRFGAHRSLQVLSLALVALGALAFAYAREELLWLVAAGLLGLGSSGAAVVNTTFVVGAGFDHETEARKLALLQLSMPAGQVLGLAFVAALAKAGFGIPAMLVALACTGAVFALAVVAVNGAAASRLLAGNGVTHPDGDEVPAVRISLRTVVFSQFGLALALTFLIMTSSECIESQYATYMDGVFGIDPELSAAALSIIMLLTIPLYLVAGRWTGLAGPRIPFLVSAAARTAAGLVLLMLPGSAGLAALMGFGVIMLTYPFFELNAAVLASKTSPIGQGAGQGASMAAYAVGSIVGAIVAGWLAERFGFASIALITAVSAGAATIFGALMLRSPANQPAGLAGPL